MDTGAINTLARNRYNAGSDSFFSDAELYVYMYAACLELARETLCVEGLATATSVTGTQTYTFPASTLDIKRITYDGRKLQPINMREDDTLTLLNQAVTTTGTPQYYYVWNDLVYLRPIPDSAKTIKYWTYAEPVPITNVTSVSIPTPFHPYLADFMCAEMAMKDLNVNAATYFKNIWVSDVKEVKKWIKQKHRGDGFASVQNEEVMAETFLGLV